MITALGLKPQTKEHLLVCVEGGMWSVSCSVDRSVGSLALTLLCGSPAVSGRAQSMAASQLLPFAWHSRVLIMMTSCGPVWAEPRIKREVELPYSLWAPGTLWHHLALLAYSPTEHLLFMPAKWLGTS